MQQTILTTGDVAKFCGVTYRTVLRWIERGTLVAYQLPGRGDHRVRLADFLNFLSTNKLPIPEEFAPSVSRVMVLQANETSGENLSQMLSAHGFEVACAHDGFHAGTLLNSFQPSVIVIDEGMRGVSCEGLMNYIRSSEQCSQTRVLVLTDETDGSANSAIEAGADDVLSKPFAESQLTHRLRALLSQARPYAPAVLAGSAS